MQKPGQAVSHSLDEAEAHGEEEGPAYAETGFLVMLALLPSVGSLLGILSFGWLLSREGRQSLVLDLLSLFRNVKIRSCGIFWVMNEHHG